MGTSSPSATKASFTPDQLARITSAEAICQEQILSPPLARATAGLVDQWGRIHRLSDRTIIGRQPQAGGIFVLEGSISRTHAEVYRDQDADAWFVRDLDSKNGTSVNDDVIRNATRLRSDDIVFFGQVGFMFFVSESGELGLPSREVTASETLRAEDATKLSQDAVALEQRAEDQTFDGLPHLPMRLIEPSGGGGGFLEVEKQQVQLTTTQFEFLRLLVDRMVRERDQPEPVRGFIRSTELLADLPWDTPHPEENHLKQLVRRVRRSLVRAGVGNLIESRRGFGYRLRVVPRSDMTDGVRPADSDVAAAKSSVGP